MNKTLIPFEKNLCSKYAEKMISIKINNRCNCNCSFCVDRGGFNPKELNVDAVLKNAIKLSEYKTVIITGGEPFLDFEPVVHVIEGLRPHKKRIVLNTNGTMLSEEKIKMLANAGLDEIQISIHHFNEQTNCKIFGRNVDFNNIRKSLREKGNIIVSINSTFNKYITKDEQDVFVNKMIDLCNYLGADKLRLTELKKVDGEDFVEASPFFHKASDVLSYNSNELITKGCTHYFKENGIIVSVKRLCEYAKGKNAESFSCCFINNDGQKKIDVDTEDTFKVIYSDGTVCNDWIFDKSNSTNNKKFDYWYLREGDFRPEHISECFNGSGVWNERGLKCFKEAGNLFLTKEEATIASEKVREFLCSINNPWCI